MSSFRINDVIYDEKSCRPSLLNFQNGKLINGKEKDLVCNLFESTDGKFMPAVASEKILYSGEINREDDLFNEFIAIRNKKTNKVRLIAVDSVMLKAKLPKSREILDSTMMEVKTTTFNELNKQFGSKRTKRATEQMERLKLDVETVREQLERTVADIKIDEKDILLETVVANYVPPIDRNASTIENVYDLHNLIPAYVLDSMSDEATKVLEAKEEDINAKNYVKQELLKLQSSPSPTKLQSAEILLYIDYLINMLTEKANVFSKKYVELCSYSNEVNQHLLDNFTLNTGRGRTRPLSMKDKTICYILVLSMIVGKNQLNLESIGTEIKTGIKKLHEFSKILSFTIHYKDKNIAQLKLPLPPPISNKRSPKKGKK